ncbi:MAG: molybdenum cofactor biosynthesis protein MoaE [Gammaproteobacteria bacterium]|nr:molybdenum cofactor biosynthesis protein MoaE [Gammaproteobacteria bacterium]MCY4165610.1 molybdenum cofactor biosynthesis protein MoaE [Gammaproteobacteria bacterium]MCY4340049.1 molybdenum cofactor biosynthesis protein MoaE [Gammaproteobacteria bacterium]
MSDFRISADAIDQAAELAALEDAASGAAVCFCGRVRNHNEGRVVVRLEYECYEELAVSEGARVLAEARERFGASRVLCVHRTGDLAIGDAAVWVGAAAAHRNEAFAAARYVIDEVKKRVPIWKREHYPEGPAEWINAAPSEA